MKHEIDIRKHAIESGPNEACGIIEWASGEVTARRCENTADDPRQSFRIDPKEYESSRDAGDLIGYYHSHPEGGAEATPPDIAIANSLGLPMWIYGGKTGELRCHVPRSAKQPLIGRRFIPQFQDCVTLVWDAASLAGIDLPHMRRDSANLHLGTRDEWKAWMEPHTARFTTGSEPIAGDMLIMGIHGASKPNHLALYIGDGHFIHQTNSGLSATEVWGGYWKRSTMAKITIPKLVVAGPAIARGELDYRKP